MVRASLLGSWTEPRLLALPRGLMGRSPREIPCRWAAPKLLVHAQACIRGPVQSHKSHTACMVVRAKRVRSTHARRCELLRMPTVVPPNCPQEAVYQPCWLVDPGEAVVGLRREAPWYQPGNCGRTLAVRSFGHVEQRAAKDISVVFCAAQPFRLEAAVLSAGNTSPSPAPSSLPSGRMLGRRGRLRPLSTSDRPFSRFLSEFAFRLKRLPPCGGVECVAGAVGLLVGWLVI